MEDKMGIDKETGLKYVSICIDKNTTLIRQLENNSIAISGEKEHNEKPQLWFNEDVASVRNEEYYFDEEECALNFTGIAQCSEGKVFISFVLPLSDVVLIDVLQHSIKKLNKLKTALETLR
jgi:hypothetical protein